MKQYSKITNVKQVAEYRLCVGCGVCAYICPEKNIQLVDIRTEGIRPLLTGKECSDCNYCLKVCPGYETSHSQFRKVRWDVVEKGVEEYGEIMHEWGPILEIWEGYADDPLYRSCGSSGGLVTAIAAYCLEREGMYGVVHVGADESIPWKNKTVVSHSREELLRRTGSRYSPASPCDRLEVIELARDPSVFVGKPCDVLGLKKAEDLRPKLKEKIGLNIGFFCAGTPSTAGLLDLLEKNSIAPNDVAEVRFRGNGWPGAFTVKSKDEDRPTCKVSYQQSWGFLQKYRPYRCHLCPDGTAEFADIACGDPWYRDIPPDEQGYSLVLVRTERGKNILEKVRNSGYAVLRRVSPDVLGRSQANLFGKRSAIWGRILAMKIFGVPVPRLEGFGLYKNWRAISLKDKLRSTLGTARRIVNRKYYIPMKLSS